MAQLQLGMRLGWAWRVPIYRKPHSFPWLVWVRRRYPLLAQAVEIQMQTAGWPVEGCSWCTAEPAEEYRSVEDPELTLRMCARCLERQQRAGDAYERIPDDERQ